MKTLTFDCSVRQDLGKKATKATRVEGKVPCVLYGGKEVSHFEITNDEIRKAIITPEIFLITLNIEKKAVKAILKDVQFHPVTDQILHVDFLEVFADKAIVMNVPVVLQGLAEGVKAGGKLSLEMRKLKVKALYSDIPEKLHINIDHLGLGKTIQVGALSFPKMELLNAKNAVVCAVKLTRAARGAAAAAKK